MNRVRSTVCALMALLAMSAVVAGSALATEGVFKDGTETELAKKGVTIKSLGNLTLATPSQTIVCTSVEGKGEVRGTVKAEFASVTAKGCNNSIAGKCSNEGLAAGEIRTKEVSLLLGLEKPSGGTEWEPALAGGALSGVSFVCGSGLTKAEVSIKGSLVGLISKEAGEATGWLGVKKEGLEFESGAKQSKGIPEGANASGEMEFRDTETSTPVKDSVKTTIKSILGEETTPSAGEGKSALIFEEAATVKA